MTALKSGQSKKNWDKATKNEELCEDELEEAEKKPCKSHQKNESALPSV